jgi:inner membrane transporter RhtA
VLVLGGIASVQIGNAWATSLFHRVGAGGAGLLRLALASVILGVLFRPRLRERARQELIPAAALGLVLAAMNLSFYHAIERIPLGIAVTIEFIGPMAVAIAGSRRPRDLVWVALAAGGILALAHGSDHSLDLLGAALAAAAGGLWGIYILVQARLGQATEGGSALVIAMVLATLAALPDGIAEGGAHLLHPGALLIGLGVGLLSSAIPYSLELEALRRIATGTFGVLMSLEPAAAALAGLILLGQGLTQREVLGILLVSAASLGVSLLTGPR